MEWLSGQYKAVEELLLSGIPEYWEALRPVCLSWLEDGIPPLVVLPLSACKAVGGRVENAVPIAAALISSAIGLRILDNLQDADKPDGIWDRIGKPRAWNYAFVFKELAYSIIHKAAYPPPVALRVLEIMNDGFIHIAGGQDRDLAGANTDMKAYWDTVDMKTGSGYASAVALGAIVGTNKRSDIAACGRFGYHLGKAVQIFNDLESIWGREDEIDDLAKKKMTLPMLLAMHGNGPDQDELLRLMDHTGEIDRKRIIAILDKMNVRLQMIELALQEREAAVAQISDLPDKTGAQALAAYFTGMFGDIEELIAIEE